MDSNIQRDIMDHTAPSCGLSPSSDMRFKGVVQSWKGRSGQHNGMTTANDENPALVGPISYSEVEVPPLEIAIEGREMDKSEPTCRCS